MPIVSEPLGRVLGDRYRLVAALGSGASAHVFLAEDLVLQRRVAVKVLQPALVHDESFLRRFRAEARSVAALNHPHVLRVFDWGEDEDGPYLVLEYLEGGSLHDMLARGRRLSIAQAARTGAQAADGLAYAHTRGLVHRDVKPANLLFDEEGRVRVADFGVARALAGSSVSEPSGGMLGTARYASPEQAQGQPLDGRSDVYSLALVLCEAVTGSVPFVKASPLATLQARIGAHLPNDEALGDLWPLLAEAADPVVAAVPALGGALASATGSLRAPDAPSLPDTGVPTANVPIPVRAAGPYAARRNQASRRWPWVTAVLVLLGCLLVAGGLYAWRTKMFVPTHHVPFVVGDPVTKAKQKLLAEHFVVHVDPAVKSTTVAAGLVISQKPGHGTLLKQGSVVTLVPSAGLPTVTVPTLTGQITCTVAQRLLTERHLKAKCPAKTQYTSTVPKGDVISWAYGGRLNPTTAPYGATIAITVSLGKPPVTIQALAGNSWTFAEATLAADGLHPHEALAYSTQIGANDVIGTTPPGGKSVPYGSTVTVTVSKGPQFVVVPTVIGDSVAKATAAIQAAGLTVGPVYGPATGQVFTTDPLKGQKVRIGSAITIYTEKPPKTTKTTKTPPPGG